MKKHLLLAFLLSLTIIFFSKESFGTHIMGGEITWTCEPNGQYIFTLKAYRDCNGVNFNVNNHALEVHNYPALGTKRQIPLTFFSVTDITPACDGSPCATLTQADPDIPGAIEEYVLKSNPITLNGIPGPNGWVFTWTYGDRNAAIDNIVNAQNFGITLRAKMYSYFGQNAGICFDSSPDFFQKPSTIICAGGEFTYNHSAYDDELDSLSYEWSRALDGQFCNPPPCAFGGIYQEGINPAILPFDVGSGYDFNSPFPDTNFDSRNVPAYLNPETGEITFTSYNQGEYVSVIKVTAYRCGQKIAEVYRELQTVITSGCSANLPPDIPSPFGNGLYRDTFRVGDFIDLNVFVYDTLRPGNPKDDSLFVFATGQHFGANYLDSTAGCAYPPCATLTYPSPDTGFGVYSTRFKWQTTCDHIANSTPICNSPTNTYLFVLRAFDDYCPAAGQTIGSFTITLLADTIVDHPDIYCADVQANGDVNLSWDLSRDPDNAFQQWLIYRSANRAGPYQLIDSIQTYATTSYLDQSIDANAAGYHYIIKAQSGCHNGWLFTQADTISTIFVNPTFNNNCVALNWNPLDIPMPEGSDANYKIFREYPIGSGFQIIDSTSSLNYCDTFNVCTDTVTYRIFIGNTGNGCTGSNSNTKGIRFKYPDPDINAGNNSTICDNQSLTLGGSPTSSSAILFLWSPFNSLSDSSLANPIASPTTDTKYFVTATDTRGCTSIDSIDVIVNAYSEANAGLDTNICLDDFPYSLNGSVNNTGGGRWIGGSGTFLPNRNVLSPTYQPSNPEILNGFVELSLIGNTVGVCAADTDQVRINIRNFNASISSTVNGISCNGLNDGNITVQVNGGNQPHQFIWNDGPLTANRTNLSSGSYTLTISNSFGCDSILSFIINEPTVLSLAITATSNVSCNGLSDGVANATANGGTLPYTYLWNDPNNTTSNTVTNLSAGTYRLTLSDNNGCSLIDSISITEPQTLVSSPTVSSNVSCFGANDGSASVNVIGGTTPYSYLWSDINNTASPSIINLSVGTFYVTITDANNCFFIDTVSISQPNALNLNISANNNVSCNGLSDGIATSIVSGGITPYTYSWNDPNNSNSDSITNLSARTYILSVTDNNGCLIIDSITITEPQALTSTIASSTNASCFGARDGSANVTAFGGTTPYTYLWSDPNSTTTSNVSNLVAGSYFVTISDANNCAFIDTVLITEPSPLTLLLAANSNVSCSGLSDGVASSIVSGGTSPYTYLWDDPNNSRIDSIINLSAGTYRLTVTDNNGCVIIDSVSISQPQPLISSPTISSNISCFGANDGSASVNPIGGTTPYSFQWSDINSSTTSFLSNLLAGTYYITITDANNCIFIDTVSVSEPPILTLSLSNDPIRCFGFNDGKLFTNVNGGIQPYSYNWSNNQVSADIVNLQNQTYTVTVNDANGCTITGSDSIVEPSALFLSVSNSDTICINSSAFISTTSNGGTGAYTYSWSSGQGNFPSISVQPTLKTTYIVTLTDANNCPNKIDSTEISVRDISQANLSLVSSGNICIGDSSTISAVLDTSNSIGPYFFSWNNGLLGRGPHIVSPAATTTYTLDIFDLCNNSISSSVEIKVSDFPPLNLNDSLIDGCEDLRVEFTNGTSAPLIHTWTFGDGTTSNRANPVKHYRDPGTYQVGLSVRNPDGCEIDFNGNYQVVVRPKPNSEIFATPERTDINNPVVNLSSNFLDAISWIWLFGDGDSSAIENPIHTYGDTGSYQIQLIKENIYNCKDTGLITFTVDPVYDIKIPNVFTPNPNGSNGGRYDPNNPSNYVFFPFVEYVEKYHLMIFNRWGELLFESKDLNIGWDGYYRDKLSPSDVYVYKLEIEFINGQKATKVGDITLLR